MRDTQSIRIAIVRLSSFGDVVVSASLLNAFALSLKSHYKHARIEWFIDERFSEILAHSPQIDTLHTLPIKRAKTPQAIRKLWRFLRACGEFDIVLDLQGLIKSAIISRVLQSRHIIGFNFTSARESLAALLYTTRVQIPYDSNILVRNAALYAKALQMCNLSFQTTHYTELDSSPTPESNTQDSTALDSTIISSTPKQTREYKALESIFTSEHIQLDSISAKQFAYAIMARQGGFSVDSSCAMQTLNKETLESAQTQPSAFATSTHSSITIHNTALHRTESRPYRVLCVLEASIPQKTYPIEQYAILMKHIHTAITHAPNPTHSTTSRFADCEVCIIYNDNKSRAIAFSEHLRVLGIAHRIFPRLDFNALKYVLMQMDCVIGGDTGVTHLAWAISHAHTITLLGNASTTSGKNMSQTKLSRVLLGNAFVLSPSETFEISSITPESIFTTWKQLIE